MNHTKKIILLLLTSYVFLGKHFAFSKLQLPHLEISVYT